MSDHHHTPADLKEIERALASIEMPPAARTRERLLYACGHAAGRADAMRRVRLSAAAAAIMMCVSTGLAWRLATLPHDAAPHAAAVATTGGRPMAGVSTATRQSAAVEPAAGIAGQRWRNDQDFDEALSHTLRVGDSLDRIAALDARAAARASTVPPQAEHAERRQMLTPASLHRAEIEWD